MCNSSLLEASINTLVKSKDEIVEISDPLPFWEALKSLDTVGSHLATLSNHQHSLTTS